MTALRAIDPTDDRLLDAKQVAALLGVPATWVYAQSREGRLPTVHLGRYKRYRRSAIEAYIAEQERGAG
jgi:excisionase family DNA binding protein